MGGAGDGGCRNKVLRDSIAGGEMRLKEWKLVHDVDVARRHRLTNFHTPRDALELVKRRPFVDHVLRNRLLVPHPLVSAREKIGAQSAIWRRGGAAKVRRLTGLAREEPL